LASIAVNAVACYFLMDLLSHVGVDELHPNGLGHVGVALSTSVVALVNFFALALFMRKRIRRLNGRSIFTSFMKIAAASGVMSVVCHFSYRFITTQFVHKNIWIRLIEAFVPIALGGVTFVLAAKILRVGELEKAFNAVTAKFRKRK